MKHIFLINPTAGKGRIQEKIITSIKNHFGENSNEHEIYLTKFHGDAEIKAKEIADSGIDATIYACGGEGTVYEILNGVIGHENIKIGVIPCGSANDFLKYFDSKESFFNIESQIDGEAIEMDLIKAGDRYCLNGCSVGMDAMVARDMSIFKNLPLVSGKMAYKLAVLKTFFAKIGVTIKLSIDNKIPEIKRCLFAVIANGPVYGGGYKAAPNAIPNDNELDFTVIDVISRFKVPAFLSKYKIGALQGIDYCNMGRCKSMSFTSNTPIPINLDGEIIEATSMTFEIVKNGIKFIVPKGVKAKILTNV